MPVALLAIYAFDDIANLVSLRPGQTVTLAVERGGREMAIVATPTLTTVDTPMGRARIGRLGVTISKDSPGVVTVQPPNAAGGPVVSLTSETKAEARAAHALMAKVIVGAAITPHS